MTRRIIGLSILGVIALGVAAFLISPLHRIFLPSGTGLAAKQICSLVFVSGLDEARARSLYVDPLMGGARDTLRVTVRDRAVTVSTLGLYGRRAVYREGLGCTVVPDQATVDETLAVPPSRPFMPLPLDETARGIAFDRDRLDAALATAFETVDTTLAVAVLHQGRLVAEQYAPGIDAATPLPGWSMTKSITATLAGHLLAEGTVDLDATIDSDCAPADHPPQTLRTLLSMTSGLDLTETNDGFDRTSQMLFTAPDMACFAARQAQRTPPGETYAYMSGNTVLAMHALQPHLGGDLATQVRALRTRLFEPLGVYSAIMEPDATGTLVGSSYMFATAQDWARLGQIYLDRGVVGDPVTGEQHALFAPDWPDHATEPAPGSEGEYGLSFWLNQDALPDDAISMRGFQGQQTIIIPSADMVVVRLGATLDGDAGIPALVDGVLAARVHAP